LQHRFGSLFIAHHARAPNLSRINWLIIAGIITGIVSFLLKGGFSP